MKSSLFYYLAALVLGAITAGVAAYRGAGARRCVFWGVFGALLIVIAFPLLLFLREETIRGRGQRKCPRCAEDEHAEGETCRSCGFNSRIGSAKRTVRRSRSRRKTRKTSVDRQSIAAGRIPDSPDGDVLLDR
jgi:hypothetical protein